MADENTTATETEAEATTEQATPLEGAETPEAPPAPQGTPPQREAMGDIVARRRHLDAAERAEAAGEEPPEETQAEEDAPAEEAEKAPDPSVVTLMVNGEAQTIPADALLPVTIDGETVLKPAHEVIGGYQQASAAQARFQEADRLATNARATMARTEQLTAQLGADPATADKADTETPETLDDAKLGELAERIQMGSPDEARDALKTVLSAGSGNAPASVDPDAIARQAAARAQVATKVALDQEQALAVFNDEYPEIVADQALYGIASSHADRVRLEELAGIGYDPAQLARATVPQIRQAYTGEVLRQRVPSNADLMRKAGDRTRKSIRTAADGPASKDPKSEDSSLADRKARKQSLNPPAPRAAARSDMGGAPPQPKSRSDVVKEAQRARGQVTA